MANWRQQTLDRAILLAIERGFDDEDFRGWGELDGLTRITAINQILHHNGVGQIIFRKSFAKAFYGDGTFSRYIGDIRGLPGVDSRDEGTEEMAVFDYHRQQCVVADDWLAYIREFMNARH